MTKNPAKNFKRIIASLKNNIVNKNIMSKIKQNENSSGAGKNKINTEPYKGVRDFYPEDMAIQNYIFSVWKKTAESFGYSEYNASILEYSNLYKEKSGDEIVNEQTYTFIDRGEREVTLRPEMTPTVARMIAAKRKAFAFPLRWYSIPNCFRYEKPQKGRLREFYQFNADIFGIEKIEADIEMISLAYQIMKNFGFKDEQFQIKINVNGNLTKQDAIDFIEKLSNIGIKNTSFSEEVVRGGEYYTGIVWEIYDTGKENTRAIFGGGRYDNLLDIFDVERVPAVGFGMGDVIIRDMLETYNILPKIKSTSELYICVMSENQINYAQNLAQKIRNDGINVTVDYSGKKTGDQIKYADKNKIPFVIVIGEEEVKTGKLKIKELETGKEIIVSEEEIVNIIKK